jgi:tetratricopeptide (TPR) repeat protein
VAAAERARALDPLSRIIGADLGEALVYAGRYDDALGQLRATVELDPSFAYAHSLLCWVHLLQRRPREAVAACEQAAALSGRHVGLGYLVHAYAAAGEPARAAAVLRELEARSRREYVSPWSIALAQLGLGDADAALAWLDRAVAERDPYLTAEGGNNPLWAPLRADPRFGRLRARMGLPA